MFMFCENKVIEVNNEGNDRTSCCMQGMCLCASLFKALQQIENNTVINITSPLVTLHSSTEMGSGNLDNITITGNGATVACNNSAILTCFYCNNIVIQETTWDQCGNSNHPSYIYAIGFVNVTNISILACTFQFSKVCKTVILDPSLSSGYIEIRDSRFLFNCVINSSQCVGYGSLAITSPIAIPIMKHHNMSILLSMGHYLTTMEQWTTTSSMYMT